MRNVIPVLVTVCLIGVAPLSLAEAATFTVDSTTDKADANPGNAKCSTGGILPKCTLRAAIMEANAHAGADTIVLKGGETYTLTVPGGTQGDAAGDLNVTDDLT